MIIIFEISENEIIRKIFNNYTKNHIELIPNLIGYDLYSKVVLSKNLNIENEISEEEEINNSKENSELNKSNIEPEISLTKNNIRENIIIKPYIESKQ